MARARSTMARTWSEFHRGVEGMHTLAHRRLQRQARPTFARLHSSAPPWERPRVCLTVSSTTRSRHAPARRRLCWKQVVKHLAQSDHRRFVYVITRGRLDSIHARVASMPMWCGRIESPFDDSPSSSTAPPGFCRLLSVKHPPPQVIEGACNAADAQRLDHKKIPKLSPILGDCILDACDLYQIAT
jgi:hypothetical protein